VTRHRLSPLSFHELTPGDEWESPARTITQADVVLFAGLSGDFNPLHCDHHYSSSGPFGRPVAHGLLVFAIATGLTSNAPRVDTLAFLSILEWRFLQPIHFDDTIHVISQVDSIEPQARGRRALVTWRRQILNQNGLPVQDGRTQTMVRGRSTPAPTTPFTSDSTE
jgi:3-hydroxybutyryl-CoA dehydratase